jgi:phosphocarrier protein
MGLSDGVERPTARRMATITNTRGLHARAAAKLVKLAAEFNSEIRLVKDGSVVSGRSIMGLMMLAAARGVTVEVRAAGDDAEAAVIAIAELIRAGFHED